MKPITTKPEHSKKAITTTSLPYTNTQPYRIVATDGDRNRLVMSQDHAERRCDSRLRIEDKHAVVAHALAKKMGWKGRLISGWAKPGVYVHVFTS